MPREEKESVKDSLESLSKEKKLELLKELITGLKEELGLKEVLNLVKKEEFEIPTSIFNKKTGSLEAIVKFLKENKSLSNTKIASLLKRSQKTIWATYQKAKKKHPESFEVEKAEFFIPLKTLNQRILSVLESIVWYLKQTYDLSFHEIAKILQRNDRTVWTVYQRAKKKEEGKS